MGRGKGSSGEAGDRTSAGTASPRPSARDEARPSYLNGPLDPAHLEALEKRLGSRLPESFRDFLVRYNGAQLGSCDTGLIGGYDEKSPVHVGELYGLHDKGWTQLGDEDGLNDLGPRFVRFASASALDEFVLQLDEHDGVPAGAVWFHHGSGKGVGLNGEEGALSANRVLYAPSFDAFLDKLVPLEPRGSEPEGGLDGDPEELAQQLIAQMPPPKRVRFPRGDKPSPERPLVLEGKARAVRKATFGISVSDEAWVEEAQEWRAGLEHLSVRYWLDIVVNARSGEDGVPTPNAQVIPVFHAAKHRHPSLKQLARMRVGPEGGWEAWYGNDAPPLEDNRLVFQGFEGTKLRLRWTARYLDGARDLPFVFEGLVHFTGIALGVKDEAEVPSYLERAFANAHRLEDLVIRVGKRIDRGPSLEDERRYFLPVRCLPRPATAPKRKALEGAAHKASARRKGR